MRIESELLQAASSVKNAGKNKHLVLFLIRIIFLFA